MPWTYQIFQNYEMTDENSYDAYEEDIALVSFYFEEPTVFEYTRHVQETLYIEVLIILLSTGRLR